MKSRNQLRREKRKQKRSGMASVPPNDANRSADPSTSPPGSPLTNKPTEPKKSSVTLLARRFDWVAESSPLYDMYQRVSSRFKPATQSQSEASQPGASESGTSQSEVGQVAPEDDFGEPNQVEGPPLTASRKRRRMESKPTLIELKKLTRRPELVDWCDADAQDPELLVLLKSLPNAVQVPTNWKSRSDIPNFPPAVPYELPPNIEATGIMELRDPDSSEALKAGQISVDYEKMYSAFFDHAPALQLTRYGEVRDPKARTMAFKPRPGPSSAKFTPGILSTRLRNALGLAPDEETPWAEAMKTQGPPPGYAHLEFTGFKLWGVAE